jgi:clan AA aspartic protease
MIRGVITSNEARVQLSIRGLGQRKRSIVAVIDTGFSAWLTLPPAVVAALRLRWLGSDRATLADGSQALFDVYEATVVWDRRSRLIPIYEANAEPLVGMTLLGGYELNIQVREHGAVTIKPLREPDHG